VAGKIQNYLASIRAGRGLTAAELAKRVGVTRQTIYAIEAGQGTAQSA
jgi:putative molybdopterin biosynthesis protein